MQSEKKFTKYLKAKDDNDQLRRGLNNLIKQGLGNDYKSVTCLAEALIILGINTIPSKDTLMRFLQNEQDNINADIGEELLSMFCVWLEGESKQRAKVETRTPQTKPRSAVRTFLMQRHESDSDGPSDDEQESIRSKIKHKIAERRSASIKHKVENDDHVFKKLVSQGNKLTEEHFESLILCHTERDEVISTQRMAAEIIRQSVDSEYHSIFDLSHTNCGTVDVQGTMYLKAMIIKFYELNPTASFTQYQRLEDIISSYGVGGKDQIFDVINFSTIVQQERSAYDKIFELTSGPKATIKSVHETSLRLLQQVGRFEYPVNAYFAAQLQEQLERSSVEYSLDDVLSKIIEHHNRMKQIGPAKCDSATVKQGDGKDSKKKGDKSATANPALKSDIGSPIKCQICSLEHSAKDCPMFYELKKQSTTRRGELFPGRPDKDGKRKGAKGSQELDSSDESTDKICLLCSQLKHVPDWASRNHTTQEC